MIQGIAQQDDALMAAAPGAGPSRGAAAAGDPPFAEVLASRGDRGGDVRALVREQARMLVATTLIQPLLAQIREDPFRSELFHGGFAEDAFGSHLDTILSDRIVDRMDAQAGAPANQAGGSALVDLVYQRIVSHPGVAERIRLEERARAYEGSAVHE